MGLTMSEKILLAGLLCLLSCFHSQAQEDKDDSTWYYANNLNDYAVADLACLVRVGDTKIIDTIGGYTIQEVSFEPVTFYKGKTDRKKFRAWLESHEVVWKAGTLQGYYLLKENRDTLTQEHPGTDNYYWLENAGFTLKDTALLHTMKDPARLKQMISQYILPGIGGSWAKVKLEELTGADHESYGPVTAHILLEEAVPALKLKKGSRVPVTIWSAAYTRHEDLLARFREKGTWEVILYRENGIMHMQPTFMLER